MYVLHVHSKFMYISQHLGQDLPGDQTEFKLDLNMAVTVIWNVPDYVRTKTEADLLIEQLIFYK